MEMLVTDSPAAPLAELSVAEVLHLFRGKKVFITGHTGFKGSWLSLLLSDAGAILKGYALAPEGEKRTLQQARTPAQNSFP